jgi:hypothetical protein
VIREGWIAGGVVATAAWGRGIGLRLAGIRPRGVARRGASTVAGTGRIARDAGVAGGGGAGGAPAAATGSAGEVGRVARVGELRAARGSRAADAPGSVSRGRAARATGGELRVAVVAKHALAVAAAVAVGAGGRAVRRAGAPADVARVGVLAGLARGALRATSATVGGVGAGVDALAGATRHVRAGARRAGPALTHAGAARPHGAVVGHTAVTSLAATSTVVHVLRHAVRAAANRGWKAPEEAVG